RLLPALVLSVRDDDRPRLPGNCLQAHVVLAAAAEGGLAATLLIYTRTAMEPTAAERLAGQIAGSPRSPALLEAMRPRQWSKNVFVFAGIVFAGGLFDLRSELRVLAVFV